MQINAAAPVIARDEILMHALIQTIWDIQTDVAGWPSSGRPAAPGVRR